MQFLIDECLSLRLVEIAMAHFVNRMQTVNRRWFRHKIVGLRSDQGRRTEATADIVFAKFRCEAAAVERRPLETALSVAVSLDGFMKRPCLQIAK